MSRSVDSHVCTGHVHSQTSASAKRCVPFEFVHDPRRAMLACLGAFGRGSLSPFGVVMCHCRDGMECNAIGSVRMESSPSQCKAVNVMKDGKGPCVSKQCVVYSDAFMVINESFSFHCVLVYFSSPIFGLFSLSECSCTVGLVGSCVEPDVCQCGSGFTGVNCTLDQMELHSDELLEGLSVRVRHLPALVVAKVRLQV